jgi:phage terminase Nu1 subunit (DNA packaging protein)
MKKKTNAPETEPLKGWRQIASFLGLSVSVAQRWARSGMPVQRKGRYVYASREELNSWLGQESSGEPIQIATENADLTNELRRGFSFVRKQNRSAQGKKKAA